MLSKYPNMDMESVLTSINFSLHDNDSIYGMIPLLRNKFSEIKRSNDPAAESRWIMKELRKMAIGNISLAALAERIGKEVGND